MVCFLFCFVLFSFVVFFFFAVSIGFENAKSFYPTKSQFFNWFPKLKTAKGLNVGLTQTCLGDQKSVY